MNFDKRSKCALTSLFVASIIWILLDPNQNIVTDLPFGATLITILMYLTKAVYAWVFVHFMRKWMFDYVDFKQLCKKATDCPIGSGLLAIAMSVVILSASLIIFAIYTN